MSAWFRPPERPAAPPRPFVPRRHVAAATLHERAAGAEAERDRARAGLAAAEAAGHAAGFAAAVASLDGRAAALVSELAPRVEAALAELAAFRSDTAREAAALAVGAAAHVAGFRIAPFEAALADAVGAAAREIGPRPELRATVHPELVDAVRARWAGLAIEADSALDRGGFSLKWTDGRMVSDPAARLAALRAALDAAIL